jgi:hypothetical protein
MVLYRTEDGRPRIHVRLIEDSAWLTLNQIVDLFHRDKPVISKHIKNTFAEKQLDPATNCCKVFNASNRGRPVRGAGKRVLPARSDSGGRLSSPLARGTQFPQWKPMVMRDWIAKLDDCLRLSDRQLLTHAGTISHDAGLAKAQAEFDKFRVIEDAKRRPVDADFEKEIEQTKQIAAARPKRKPKEAK